MEIGDFVKIKEDCELSGDYPSIGKITETDVQDEFDIRVEFTDGGNDIFNESELIKVTKLKWLCKNAKK